MAEMKGIAQSATPSTKHTLSGKKAPAAKELRRFERSEIGKNPYELNPGVKGFHRDSMPKDFDSAFPEREFGRRMVTRGPVGGDETRGQSQF